jgi:hypothetical protein
MVMVMVERGRTGSGRMSGFRWGHKRGEQFVDLREGRGVIKTGHTELWCEAMEWIQLAQSRVQMMRLCTRWRIIGSHKDQTVS